MSSFNADVTTELRRIVAKLQDLDFSSPLDALRTIKSLVGRVYEVATEPPKPDPENARTSAVAWKRMAESMDLHQQSIQNARNEIGEDAWGRDQGDVAGPDSGDAARRSVDKLKSRAGTVAPAGQRIATGLSQFADDMSKARSRHDNAFDDVAAKLSVGQIPIDPRKWDDYVKEIAQGVVHGVGELIGSYEDATNAATTAASTTRGAVEGITLPDHVSGAMGAVSSVNGWSGAERLGKDTGSTDSGPLREGVLERADARIAAMSETDRQAVQQMLSSAKTDQQRAWIMAAVASGADVNTLRNFAGKVGTMSPDELARLDPIVFAGDEQAKGKYAWRDKDGNGPLNQPDDTTCGSASLVTAKMINDPVYAMKVLTGYDATTGQNTDDGGMEPGAVNKRFSAEAIAMHDRTNGLYPEQLGTSPWGAAEQMGDGSGTPGTQYEVHYADPANLGREFERIASAAQSGQVVPLYVGGDTFPPRHVVLVVGSQGDSLQIYEPSSGQTHTVPREAFVNGTSNAGFGYWGTYWGSVVPR